MKGIYTIMKTGLFGQQLTLMEELKAETFTAHGKLQCKPFFKALAACQLPLESYVGQLRALTLLHSVLEQALDNSTDTRTVSVWQRDMSRLPQLQQDLRYFEPRTVADLKEASAVVQRTAEVLRLKSIEQPLMLLGYLYVLEGSMLGAVTLRPLYARAFLLANDNGIAYLHTDGEPAHARWSHFQQRMNALCLENDEREQIVQAANEFFMQIEALFDALYPFKPESRVYLVTSINPEAGRHPIPADACEVQASIKAADACWNRYPYFEQRYGERGLRFARSDAAWQATLYEYEPEQIIQQTQWLGRILAVRGMPTLLLQVQLEILVDTLTAANPGNKSAYEKILPAIADIRESRMKFISCEQADAIEAEFEVSVGHAWCARYPGTGALLVSAVADELGGCAGAVQSFRTWMTEPERFPAKWIAAVESALDHARSIASVRTHKTQSMKNT